MTRILFQGDSITDGNRYKDPASRWDLNHQIGHSYVFNIAGTLGRRAPGRYTIINRGISGDTVEKIAARWQRDTLDEKPDILSILLGINGNGNFDGNFEEGQDEHLSRFETGYRNLLIAARETNPALKLILVEPFVLPVGPRKEHFDTFMPFFRRKQGCIRHIAQDFGAVFIPVQDKLDQLVHDTAQSLTEENCAADPYAYWLWDGVHPTEAMHSFLADLWLEGAEPILKNGCE